MIAAKGSDKRGINRGVVFFLALLLLAGTGRPGFGTPGIDIGMHTWFTWWNPPWENVRNVSKYTLRPSFLYGPLVSFRLPGNVAISNQFLYGEFTAADNFFLGLTRMKSKKTIKRVDNDTTISYSFMKFMRVFLGFKYSRYSYDTISYAGPAAIKDKTTFNEYAPGIGIGFTAPLASNLYLIANLSTIYDFCLQKSSLQFISLTALPARMPSNYYKNHRIGFNSTLSLAYYISRINLMVIAGGRYQFFKIVKSNNSAAYDKIEHFYGVTASVVYRIDFPARETDEAGSVEKTGNAR